MSKRLSDEYLYEATLVSAEKMPRTAERLIKIMVAEIVEHRTNEATAQAHSKESLKALAKQVRAEAFEDAAELISELFDGEPRDYYAMRIRAMAKVDTTYDD